MVQCRQGGGRKIPVRWIADGAQDSTRQAFLPCYAGNGATFQVDGVGPVGVPDSLFFGAVGKYLASAEHYMTGRTAKTRDQRSIASQCRAIDQNRIGSQDCAR